jgi:hypothetical protein
MSSPRSRAVRFGGSIAVGLAGVACGIVFNGTLGGTLATVLIGVGLVGIVSFLFLEVGLSEDRDRAAAQRRAAAARETEPSASADPHTHPASDRHPAGDTHDPARRMSGARRLQRRRGERRRLG